MPYRRSVNNGRELGFRALDGIFDYRRDMFAKLFDGTEADVPPTQQPELQEA